MDGEDRVRKCLAIKKNLRILGQITVLAWSLSWGGSFLGLSAHALLDPPFPENSQTGKLMGLYIEALAEAQFFEGKPWDRDDWKVWLEALRAAHRIEDWKQGVALEKRLGFLVQVERDLDRPVLNRLFGLPVVGEEAPPVFIESSGPDWNQIIKQGWSGKEFRYFEVPPIFVFLLFPDFNELSENPEKLYWDRELYRFFEAKTFLIENAQGEIVGFESWQKVKVKTSEDQRAEPDESGAKERWFVEIRPGDRAASVADFEDWLTKRVRDYLEMTEVVLWPHSQARGMINHPAHVLAPRVTRIQSPSFFVKNRLLGTFKSNHDQFLLGGPRNPQTLPPLVAPRVVSTPLPQFSIRGFEESTKMELVNPAVDRLLEILNKEASWEKSFLPEELGELLFWFRKFNLKRLDSSRFKRLEVALVRLTESREDPGLSEKAFVLISELGLREEAHRRILFQRFQEFMEITTMHFDGDLDVFRTGGSVEGETLQYYPYLEKALVRLIGSNAEWLDVLMGALGSDQWIERFTAVQLLSRINDFSFEGERLRELRELVKQRAHDFAAGVSTYPLRWERLDQTARLHEHAMDSAVQALSPLWWNREKDDDLALKQWVGDNSSLSDRLRRMRPDLLGESPCRELLSRRRKRSS